MSEWRRSGWWSPARWYTVLGFAVLVFSLWLPWLSASRTTRVENRADGLAECLLEVASEFPMPIDEADKQCILARFFALAVARGLRTSRIERIEPAPEDVLLCLENKHYTFQLSVSPPDAQQQPGKGTVPAIEVIAWPSTAVGPGHGAFFYPENAERAYTRNLRKSYHGRGDDRPKPGAAHRRPGLGSGRPMQYTGDDGEHWKLF